MTFLRDPSLRDPSWRLRCLSEIATERWRRLGPTCAGRGDRIHEMFLPAFNVVGLADKAVSEARERVRSALVASGRTFLTNSHLTILRRTKECLTANNTLTNAARRLMVVIMGVAAPT